MVRAFFIILNLLVWNAFFGQIKNSSFSAYYLNSCKPIHSSIQPYLESHQFSLDTVTKTYKSKWIKKLFSESLLNVKEDDIHLTADPLFNFTISQRNENLDFRYYSNVRGFRITGDLVKNFSFETRFYENQFYYPDYLKEKSDLRSNPTMGVDGIGFGIGRAKNFKNYGSDASLANGYLSYSPNKYINFQIGHGRHFFGDGYRSHLISDYAPDYPYISGQYYLFENKLLYKHVTAWMRNLIRIPASSTPEALFIPKAMSFNQLSFSPNSKWSISVFEGGVYQSFDMQNGNITPDFSFYFPIVGLKLMDFDTVNNIIYGLNWSFNIFENLKIYNQIALKSFKFSNGFQLGLNWGNPFKLENSFLNVEWNNIPAGLYSMKQGHQNQSYSHLGHELAHPMGSGFQEYLIRGQFSKGKVFMRFNYNLSNLIEGYNGNEVFEPLDNSLFGIKSDKYRLFLNTNIGLTINKSSNMEISVGHTNRRTNNNQENYLFISWRTYLKNDYFDQ